MWKRSFGTLLGTSLTATVLAIGLAATPSLATTATTWSVTPGGSFSGSSSSVTFTDTATEAPLVCSSSSISGKLKSGSGLAGTHIASITALSFSSCVGLGSSDYTLTTGEDFPYYLNTNSYDAASGKTTATVTGIVATLEGNFCNAAIWGTTDTTPGTVKGEYTNSTHKLKIITNGSTLHVYNVNQNCAALTGWGSGDPLTMSGTYTITPAQVITSP
jgi:hypothetical protein